MCILRREIDKKSAIGYKVVAKHKETGEYYSVAFGFKYKQPIMTFGVQTGQRQIGDYFFNNIVTVYGISGMENKSAAFVSVSVAHKLLSEIIRVNSRWDLNHKFVVVKVRLSEMLWEGTYFVDDPCAVVAGHKMKILEEV